MTSKLNKTQRLARLIGKDAGPNTWFSGGISNPDNRNVYVQVAPLKVSKPLGSATQYDLKRIIKARFQGRD